jgi:histidinol-phosphate aminotransferase
MEKTKMIRPKKSIEKMEPYSPPISSRCNFIRLDFNENFSGCSPFAIEVLKTITRDEVSMYPDYNELRNDIAKLNNIDPSKILPINAGDEGIMLMMNTFLEKNDKILLPTPTFAMFKFYAQINDANIVEVKYNEDLSFPIINLLEKIDDKTKLIILVNPNNPTGTSIKKEDIIRILNKAKNSIVFLDEAYFDFTKNTCIDLIDKYDNLVILRSFSKAYGLAGLRLGYLISCEDNIKIFQKVNSPYSISFIANKLLKAAIQDKDYVENYICEIKDNKNFLYEEFEKLKIKYFKGDANFFLADFGTNYNLVYQKLKENNILVRDRNTYVKNTLRITVGTKQQCKLLINILKKILLEIYLNNVDTVLFDMDGVLVDVSNSYRLAIKRTAEFFLNNKQITFDEIQSYKEKGGLNNDWVCTLAILKDNNEKISKEKLIEKFDDIYLNETIKNEKLIVDLELLKIFSQKYNIGIITGRPRRDAEITIKKFGFDKFFSNVITMDEEKDKSIAIRNLMKKFESINAVYIGDTIDDIISANKANINSIGIKPIISSKNLPKLLKKIGAKFVLNNINELLRTIK